MRNILIDSNMAFSDVNILKLFKVRRTLQSAYQAHFLRLLLTPCVRSGAAVKNLEARFQLCRWEWRNVSRETGLKPAANSIFTSISTGGDDQSPKFRGMDSQESN